MDNFKRRRPQSTPRSVDGFVTGRRYRYHGSGSTESFSRSQRRNGPSPTVGDFKRSEGFHPSERPVAGMQHLAARDQQSIIATEVVTETERGSGRRPDRAGSKSDDSKRKLLSRKKRDAKVKQSKDRNWKKISKRTALGLAVTVILVGGVLFGKGFWKLKDVFRGGSEGAAALQDNVDPTQLRGEGDGRVNILLLGKGGDGHTAPDLTDTILLASIDPLAKEAALLSIPRDLYVETDDHGSMKINAVYATAKNSVLHGRRVDNQEQAAEAAGFAAIRDTVEDSMGVPVHYHVMVDFEAFQKAIDTVGGVTIEAPEALYDSNVAWENGGSSRLAVAGTNHFNGHQALLYARSRMGSARGDFDRAERQRLILLALKDKVLSVGTFSNPLKISQLLDAFGSHVSTDLSLNEVMRLYDLSREIDGSKIASIGLADPPNDYVSTANIGGQSVVVPKAGIGNFKEIQHFVRNNLKDGFIRNENASILILNGTDRTGLAGRRSDELKSFGYNVIGVGDAPSSDYQQTTLVDLRNGEKKYTRSYLEKRLGVTAVGSLPDATIDAGTADFVIILGANEPSSTQ